MAHRLDVQGDSEWQKVGERLDGQPIRDEGGPLRLHEEQLGGGRLREESSQGAKRGRLVALAAAVEERRAGELEGPEQRAEQAGLIAFDLEWGTAV